MDSASSLPRASGGTASSDDQRGGNAGPWSPSRRLGPTRPRRVSRASRHGAPRRSRAGGSSGEAAGGAFDRAYVRAPCKSEQATEQAGPGGARTVNAGPAVIPWAGMAHWGALRRRSDSLNRNSRGTGTSPPRRASARRGRPPAGGAATDGSDASSASSADQPLAVTGVASAPGASEGATGSEAPPVAGGSSSGAHGIGSDRALVGVDGSSPLGLGVSAAAGSGESPVGIGDGSSAGWWDGTASREHRARRASGTASAARTGGPACSIPPRPALAVPRPRVLRFP